MESIGEHSSRVEIQAAPEAEELEDMEIKAVTTDDSVTMSGLTFANRTASPGVPTVADTEMTPGRKIHREDVKNVFRGSTTTGVVNQEQICRIQRMHNKISDGVNWDFNYSCLLMVASVVAGLGLVVDSATTVISLMLLSPIMGPVIGISYGLIIWDIPLIKRSVRNELLSILVCIIFGLIIGLCTFWTQLADTTWPTDEMLSRCTRSTFLAGIPIAFFSGLGVALSVLDDQTSSLVGVAISASLLPPAVNCGILLIMAAFKDSGWSDFKFSEEGLINQTTGGWTTSKPNWSQEAIMSLMLTVANVICVAAGATLMFRLKEVLPVKKKVFWEDLKVARRIYTGRAIDSSTGDVLSAEKCHAEATEISHPRGAEDLV